METPKLGSVLLLGAVLTVACGDSNSSLNPTAPSAVSAAVQHDPDAATGGASSTTGGPKGNNGNGNGNGNNGNGNGNGNGSGDQPTAPSAPTPPGTPTARNTTPTGPIVGRLEIEGLITAVDDNTITVGQRMVFVPEDVVIRHGNRLYELDELREGDRVHIKANRVAAASGESLVATLVLLQNPGDDTGEDPDAPAPPPPPPPPPPAVVSVLATDANAWETGPNTGTFTLTRTGGVLSSTLTVTFALSGATNGTDYTPLPTTATFAADSTTATVTVTPIADSLAEGNESVVLTLTGASQYVLGSPATATVVIADGAVPVINVIVLDGTATEAGGPGSFRVTRTGDTTVGLTVTVAFAGTATNGTDYTTSLANQAEVVFPANVAAVTVTVVPQRDTVTDPSETVILMVIDGAAYDLGATPSGQVNISGS